jgi:hypothetical protein
MISFGFSARPWQQIEAERPITGKTMLRIREAFDVPLVRLVRGGIFRTASIAFGLK